jgi:hypothetical protein
LKGVCIYELRLIFVWRQRLDRVRHLLRGMFFGQILRSAAGEKDLSLPSCTHRLIGDRLRHAFWICGEVPTAEPASMDPKPLSDHTATTCRFQRMFPTSKYLADHISQGVPVWRMPLFPIAHPPSSSLRGEGLKQFGTPPAREGTLNLLGRSRAIFYIRFPPRV